ncbi:MAG: peptidylprolyl isomerase [Urechidicola sp.]|nr:peptidylprolyl isomerase [Urechidicola sp.]
MKKIILAGLILSLTVSSCASKQFKEKWTKEQAPKTFKARFETTQGSFEIVSIRQLSPKGVDRLYQLIKHGFYTDIALFRVLPDFVVQFGIHGDSIANSNWEHYKIPDEPVLHSNDSMTISFARGGVETRTTQIFINMKDNPRLDELEYSGVKGFPVIAKVTSGFETIRKFYADYGAKPATQQDSIYMKGNDFLRKEYPEMDYIIKATIIK